MGYYLANRLLEIKQHLGPVLKELKLATRACCPPDSIRIEFVSPRARAHFSPVMISFEDKKKSGLAEASWQKASVQVAGWECRQLRDSDWVSWKWGEISSREIKGEGEQMFEWLRFVIDYHGVVPNLIGSKKCIAFPAFADAYNQFAEFVKIDITQDVGPGWTGRETMHFVDLDGRHVQVEFSLNKMQASVIVDGEVLDRFGSSDEGAVEKWVTRLVDPVYRSRRDQEGFTFRPRF